MLSIVAMLAGVVHLIDQLLETERDLRLGELLELAHLIDHGPVERFHLEALVLGQGAGHHLTLDVHHRRAR